jgi:hypothetical protein
MLKLADRFGLDLTHTLTRNLKDPSDFLERVGVAVPDAVAKRDDLAG